MELQPIFIQMLALLLFAIGLATALARRNVFFVLMGIELALNAVNLSFVGSRRLSLRPKVSRARSFRCSRLPWPLPKRAWALHS